MIRFDISDNHWTLDGFRETVTQEELREWLRTHDYIIRRGQICDLKKEYLGAGMYTIWFEPRRGAEHKRERENQ